MSSLPPKRRRVNSVLDSQIDKHASLYLEKGNIVLFSLPHKNVITAFRVDMVFLSRGSKVFQDMISFPEPGKVETYDETPLVRLSDEAKDLEQLIKALYNPNSLPTRKYQPHTVMDVEGALALATKYQFDDLRDRIVAILSADWPAHLLGWDANEAELAVLRNDPDSEESCLDIGYQQDPASVVRIARAYDVPGILTAAFYDLSRLPPWADEDAWPLDDVHYDLAVWHRSAGGGMWKSSRLSRDDLHCLLKGTQYIRSYITEFFIKLPAKTWLGERCTAQDRNVCNAARLYGLVEFQKAAWKSYLDPLALMRDVNPHIHDGMCDYCTSNVKNHTADARRELWDLLPKYFKLKAT